MKIIVFGTRGVPDISGGVETHCEELYPHLVDKYKHDILIISRSVYAENRELKEFKGVRIKTLFAPKSKMLEAILHSFIALCYAVVKRPDLLHIHAVGPNLVTPLARLLGLKVVMTHHGPDYKRQKWGHLAKLFLRLGEWSGVRYANSVIVISQEIKSNIKERFDRDVALIPNGVSIKGKPKYNSEYLNKYGLDKQKYIFALGRFVPEKGFDYLITAFQKANLSSQYKLVIAGDSDHETEYSQSLKTMAKENGVVLTGYLKGEELSQLFAYCRLFVIPSFYEGLPIALLEAMAYGVPILASDIEANTQVQLPESSYFKVGEVDILAEHLKALKYNLTVPTHIQYNKEEYDWEIIATKTHDVYLAAMGVKKNDYLKKYKKGMIKVVKNIGSPKM